MTETLESQLRAAGLGKHVNALMSLAQPCLDIRIDHDGSEHPAVGGSRLGGSPDVPEGFEWPVWRDLPLSFIGQINLAETAVFAAAAPLPTTGVLSFFYHPEQSAWGFDPLDRGSARVYYFDETTALREAMLPSALPDHGRFRPGHVSFREALSLPPRQALAVRALKMSSDDDDAYSALREESQDRRGEGPQHQLLGHPSPVQDEMQLECQLVSNGIYCGNPAGYKDPRRAGLEPGARDWRLLLQVDSDDPLGMMWGDMGMLYFWITEANLAARGFDQSWTILQCF